MMILDEPTVGMDSLLRQRCVCACVCVFNYFMISIFYCSVWQYIGELTVAKQCTVIITTHYIDEARRANTVSTIKCC